MSRSRARPETIDRLRGVPAHERFFYTDTRAFGRFGMRDFAPTIMPTPHRHGHVEANFARGADLTYDVEGERIVVPEGRLFLFWAGIAHQLVGVQPTGEAPPRLANLYLPVDAFLLMPHVGQLQIRLLGGGMALLPGACCPAGTVERWYADYRSGDFERTEILRMELGAVLRRALLGGIEWLRPSAADAGEGRALSSSNIRHAVEMLRFILENLEKPLSNAEVAAVTGLHQNYAMTIFTQTMHVPMKRFILRMRMLRARALLLESTEPVAAVADAAGYSSPSQFYAAFRAAYGMSPAALRARYAAMELR